MTEILCIENLKDSTKNLLELKIKINKITMCKSTYKNQKQFYSLIINYTEDKSRK
jgi:hypothetical protein